MNPASLRKYRNKNNWRGWRLYGEFFAKPNYIPEEDRKPALSLVGRNGWDRKLNYLVNILIPSSITFRYLNLKIVGFNVQMNTNCSSFFLLKSFIRVYIEISTCIYPLSTFPYISFSSQLFHSTLSNQMERMSLEFQVVAKRIEQKQLHMKQLKSRHCRSLKI